MHITAAGENISILHNPHFEEAKEGKKRPLDQMKLKTAK
jgi:hypothetical protein